MQKKIKMTKEQEALFKMMKSLAKRVNQRIVRLEREFGENTYIVSNLKESLDISPLQAWSEKRTCKSKQKIL